MFTQKIIVWYQKNKRPLPWREINNTYFIWLSEIILQQTRVNQGLPYYNKFIEAFPTIDKLAKAEEEKVLQLWQGLGYYSRARNLHKCAKEVVENYKGAFPRDYAQLLKLPGIGPYTAAAIASLGYDIPVPVVDGNVYRVLARVFGIWENIADAKSFKFFFQQSEALINKKLPGDYNQAVMELGATVCLPQNPLCSVCPVESLCYAKEKGKQADLPVKIKKVKKRSRFFTYLVLEVDGKLAFQKRSGKDIWQGLYEFYKIESDTLYSAKDIVNNALISALAQSAVIEDETVLPKHLLSHQTIFSTFIKLRIKPNEKVLKWMRENGLVLYSKEQIEKLPKPVLITRYLNNVAKSIYLQ